MAQANQLEMLVTGVVLGVHLLVVAGAWTSRLRANLRWAVTLFCLSGIANIVRAVVLMSGPGPDLWPLERIAHFIGVGHPGWVLLLAYVLFEDRKLSPQMFAGAAALFAITAIENALRLSGLAAGGVGGVVAGVLDGLRDGVRVGLLVWTAVVVFRSWRSDLVDWRRRLRWGVFAVTAVYALVSAPALWMAMPGWVEGVGFWLQAVLVVGGAALALQVRADVAAPAVVTGVVDRVSEASRLALARLNVAMTRGELWRQEGLTIAVLAVEAGVSERQLRRLINEKMGHRNFAGFVNGYRIEAAKVRLSDPVLAGRTIAEVAFELGYASLGPFNRAFKEATGMTPSAWRKAGMAEAPAANVSPKAAKAG